MKKYIFLLLIVLAISLAWVFWAKPPFASRASESKVHIVTTSSELASIATHVGGEYAETQTLFSGAQSMSQEPTEKQLKAIRNSDVFMYQGGEVHDWAGKLAADLAKQGTVVIKYKPAALTGQSEKELNKMTADRLARVLEILDIPHANTIAQNAKAYIDTQK